MLAHAVKYSDDNLFLLYYNLIVMAQKNSNSPVVLFCIVFGTIIAALFLVNANKIKNVLEETKFFDSVFGKNTTTIQVDEEEIAEPVELDIKNNTEAVTIPLQTNTGTTVDITAVTEDTGDEAEEQIIKSENDIVTEVVPADTKMTKTNLYFMYIDGTGSLLRKTVEREVPAASPLSPAIKTLLNGPNAEEEGKNYISLIPEGTKLISATVKDKVAYLNFNDDFQWNKYGSQGYFGQLMQIVYTATEFSTVERVQILIDSQKLEFLGNEGIWIGSPLSRNSFD